MLFGRLLEFVSRMMPFLVSNYQPGSNRSGSQSSQSRKPIRVTLILTCAVPLFCLSGGVSYLLGMQKTECYRYKITDDHWKPVMNISDRLVARFNVSFPISHQSLVGLEVKDASTMKTLTSVSGGVNICRMLYTINHCLSGFKRGCFDNQTNLNRNETHQLAKFLHSTVIC